VPPTLALTPPTQQSQSDLKKKLVAANFGNIIRAGPKPTK
jgi:hypothetical protein